MANPFYVQPAQYGQALQQAAGAVDQFAQKQYMDEAKKAMASAFQSQDPMAIRDAVMKYPEIAETATQMFGFTNDQTEQVARETYRRALSETDPQRRAAIMEGGIETVGQFGGNPRMMSQDLRLLRENPEAFDRSAKAGYAAIASDQEFEALFSDGAGGPSIGTYNPRDYTTESFAEFAQTGDPSVLERYEGQRSVEIGGVPHVFDPARGGYYPARVGGGQGDSEVTTESVASSQGQIAATEEASTQAIKTSKEAFDKIRPIKKAIANVDEAIGLIDDGAKTGVVYSKLPSVQEASIALDNLQGRLGLDVIGNTTFGALSESELKFALDTALPKNLEGPALKRWLQRKQESQKKLARYLEDAATFLGRPGNTIADFVERQKSGDGGSQNDIMSMSLEKLQGMDPADMSPSELEQAAQRYEQLGAE